MLGQLSKRLDTATRRCDTVVVNTWVYDSAKKILEAIMEAAVETEGKPPGWWSPAAVGVIATNESEMPEVELHWHE